METIEVPTFDSIAAEFDRRVRRVVWCSVATVDARGRPRSRILHPIWEGQTAWITTWRDSFKARHLERNRFVSLAYVAEIATPVYADCRAEWVDDLPIKRHIWDLIASTPEPVGFDPAPIYGTIDNPRFGVLKLTPWRIEVADIPTARRVWHAKG